VVTGIVCVHMLRELLKPHTDDDAKNPTFQQHGAPSHSYKVRGEYLN
jgi:hypothetical protein